MGDLQKEGVKYDGGKSRVELIPSYAMFIIGDVYNSLGKVGDLPDLCAIQSKIILKLGDVYAGGAIKYADNNWRKGMDWTRIYGACKRHMLKWLGGEDNDPEFGLSHLIHSFWSLVTLIEYEKICPDRDDRVTDSPLYTLYSGNDINIMDIFESDHYNLCNMMLFYMELWLSRVPNEEGLPDSHWLVCAALCLIRLMIIVGI